MPPDRLGTPDILLMVSEEVLVFDNLAGTIRLIVNADPSADHALRKGAGAFVSLGGAFARAYAAPARGGVRGSR